MEYVIDGKGYTRKTILTVSELYTKETNLMWIPIDPMPDTQLAFLKGYVSGMKSNATENHDRIPTS